MVRENGIRAMETAKAPPATKLQSAFEWTSVLVMAAVAVSLVFQLLFRVVTVSGNSMFATLQNGDKLLLTTLFYTPERGDVVVIRRPGSEDPLIKRVIAVGGDRLFIDNETGQVYLNGTLLDEPYTYGAVTPAYDTAGEVLVPEGHIFAMGDNRGDSLDSRILGTFPVKQVMGEVSFRLLPRPGQV